MNKTLCSTVVLMLSIFLNISVGAQDINKLVVVNIKNGDTIRGTFNLKIRVPNYGKEGDALTVIVDGNCTSYSAYQAHKTAYGFISLIPIDTDAYSNGWHNLTIRSTSQQQVQYRIKCANDVSQIDVESIANPSVHIVARNETNKLWQVAILATDNRKSIIRLFHGHGSTINVRWNGKDNHGKTSPNDSSYLIAITAGQSQPHLRSLFKTSGTETN